MGVSVPRVFSMSWGLSAVLAAIAGILLAPLITITPDMGVIGIKGFVGAILGGYLSSRLVAREPKGHPTSRA